MNGNGMLVVVSAPSGCGKDTVFKEIRKKRDDIVESVSATTRKPRDGEIDGVNYYFLSDDEFKKLIEKDGLLEYAVYNNCYYGTPVEGVNEAIKTVENDANSEMAKITGGMGSMMPGLF